MRRLKEGRSREGREGGREGRWEGFVFVEGRSNSCVWERKEKNESSEGGGLKGRDLFQA